jgi:phosphatidylserine/phosphatidylglycerophosphate/cardiolipin synthase-like enzyme
MTQKDKDLLLNDLCARSPYEVKFRHKYIDNFFHESYTTSTLIGVLPPYRIIHSTLTGKEYLQIEEDEVKPYLFPLSSITEEQNKELQKQIKSNPLSDKNLKNNNLKIYFSPQDKSITNAILPIIKNAQKYIYIPTFVLTEKRITEELIKAKQRGVDVKIIIDALNASIHHSKHNELRAGGLLVKTENYAGKMH